MASFLSTCQNQLSGEDDRSDTLSTQPEQQREVHVFNLSDRTGVFTVLFISFFTEYAEIPSQEEVYRRWPEHLFSWVRPSIAIDTQKNRKILDIPPKWETLLWFMKVASNNNNQVIATLQLRIKGYSKKANTPQSC